MTGRYDLRLVALSVLIAMIAAYATLDVAGRVKATRKNWRIYWVVGGASSMGCGIWAMHYIGMLAFKMPMTVFYDLPTVGVSLLAAIAASLVAFFTVSRERVDRWHMAMASIFMGGGIASMHYIGMAAMRMPARTHYNSLIVAVSLVLAVTISYAALLLCVHEEARTRHRKIASVLVMGSAIPAMHYSGMWAATFVASNDIVDRSHAATISDLGIAAITLCTLLILGLAIGTAFLDRLIAAQRTLVELARQNEDHFRTLAEAIPQMVWTARPDGYIDFLNKRWFDYTGLTHEQSEGEQWRRAVHPEDLPSVEPTWQQALREGNPYETEYRLFRASDQTYRWHLGRAHPVCNARGTVVRWFGTCTDIEDQKRNQENLQQMVQRRTEALETSNQSLLSEIAEKKRNEAMVRRLSAAVEQSPVSVVITDLSGRINYVNRKFVDITGYSYDEIIGQHPRILKSGRTSAAEYKCLWETITAGGEWRGEFCNRKKNGDFYWESAAVRAIRDETGNITHFLAVKEDITEHRQMRAQLEQSQKLEAVGPLAAGVAHEINTPMQFIGNNIKFLQEAWSSLDGFIARLGSLPQSAGNEFALPQLLENLQAADIEYLNKEVPTAIAQSLDGVERVTKIVLALKEFSHPASNVKQRADINRAIETTVTVARNEWRYVADMELALSDNIGLVPCYLDELNQVLLNLIVNAAHAIADVADGSISKGKITIRTSAEPDAVIISVQDTGPGIPPSVQPHIFEPFFTTKPLGKGTGQGLALAYTTIVKKHAGAIWFETKEGSGSTFFLRLPAGTAEATPEQQAEAAKAGS